MSSRRQFRMRLLKDYQHEVGHILFGMDNQLSPPSSVHSHSSNSPHKDREPEINIKENETSNISLSPDAMDYIDEDFVMGPKSSALFDDFYKFKKRLEACFEELKEPIASRDFLKKINPTKNLSQLRKDLQILTEKVHISNVLKCENHCHFGNYSEIKKDNNPYPMPSPNCVDKIIIGPNHTKMLKSDYDSINWSLPPSHATRRILMAIFSRAALATHSLNKPEKLPLNPCKVDDIIFIITRKKNVTAKEVRMAITMKCADECKMSKGRDEKKKQLNPNWNNNESESPKGLFN